MKALVADLNQPSSTDMAPELHTQRLVLCPLKLSDANQTQLLFAQWEVVKYLTKHIPWPYPADGMHQYYRDIALPAAERDEAWHWTLRLKSSPDQLIGSISLMKDDNNNRGFWLGVPWHGQGLMTEACVAVNDYWFDTLGFVLMRVPKAAANLASRRISEKTGMRIVATDEREYVSGWLHTEVWELTAAEWQLRRAKTEPMK